MLLTFNQSGKFKGSLGSSEGRGRKVFRSCSALMLCLAVIAVSPASSFFAAATILVVCSWWKANKQGTTEPVQSMLQTKSKSKSTKTEEFSKRKKKPTNLSSNFTFIQIELLRFEKPRIRINSYPTNQHALLPRLSRRDPFCDWANGRPSWLVYNYT